MSKGREAFGFSQGVSKFSPIFSRSLKVFSRSTGKLKVQDLSRFGSKRVLHLDKSEGLRPCRKNVCFSMCNPYLMVCFDTLRRLKFQSHVSTNRFLKVRRHKNVSFSRSKDVSWSKDTFWPVSGGCCYASKNTTRSINGLILHEC